MHCLQYTNSSSYVRFRISSIITCLIRTGFFETPVVYATYTYIMDVDVMVLDDIVPLYAAHFPNKPHLINNIIRKNTNHLTGMHYVHTKNYFTPKLKRVQKELYHSKKKYSKTTVDDEAVLYDIVQRAHPLPPRKFQWRPIFRYSFLTEPWTS